MLQHRICIVGGTGFVGRHLVNRLAADGHQIRVVARRPHRHAAMGIVPHVELVEGTVAEDSELDRLFTDCDVVINLVGILNERRSGDFERLHAALPHRIARACHRVGVPRLLHMSALNADAGYAQSRYLRSKGNGENAAHTVSGLHVTSFRPSVIFGHDDSFFNRFADLLRRIPLIFPLACPEARFAPIYVGDVIEVMARSITTRATFGNRYNLCGPGEYTLRQLVAYTAHHSGLHRCIIGLNGPLSRLQAHLLGLVPGKPMSYDNYLSMQHPSVCEGGFPAEFGIAPRSIDSVVPIYLAGLTERQRYDRLRRLARRD